MTYVYDIDENIVADIQLHDASVITHKAVIQDMLTTHAYDKVDVVTNNVVFKKYQEDLNKEFIAFEAAKNVMIERYVPAEIRAGSFDWNLDYNTCKLTVTVN